MEISDYLFAWIIYVVAGIALALIAWHVFKKYFWREFAYLCQCLLIAIIFTPWYVLTEEDILAPAIIIFAMDTITIDPVAGIRALIPLVLAFVLALVVTLALVVMNRLKRKKRQGVAEAIAARKKRMQRKVVSKKQSVTSKQ